MKAFIYALIDPLTKKVRYVGKTNNIQRRYDQHIRNVHKTDSYCQRWIQSLLRQSKKPRIRILEECKQANWEEREIYWISFYRSEGNLTNIADGGIGFSQLPLEKQMQRRTNIRKSRLGMVFPEHHIKKLKSAARRKFRKNPSLKENLSRMYAVLSDEQVREVWALAHEGVLTQKEISEKYGISASTVSEIKHKKRYVHALKGLSDRPQSSVDREKRKCKNVLELYKSGVPVEEIAEMEKVAPGSIRKRLSKELGMPVAAYESMSRKQKVQKLLSQSKKLSEIDKILGFKKGTSSAIMNPKRSRSSDKFVDL